MRRNNRIGPAMRHSYSDVWLLWCSLETEAQKRLTYQLNLKQQQQQKPNQKKKNKTILSVIIATSI